MVLSRILSARKLVFGCLDEISNMPFIEDVLIFICSMSLDPVKGAIWIEPLGTWDYRA